MKHNPITSGLFGAFALALSAVGAVAQPGNFGSSQQTQPLNAVSNPLVLVRAGGGGGGHGGGFGGGGGHAGGFGGGHVGGMGGSFRGGHVGGMSGHVGRMAGSHGFDGRHFHHFRHHARSRFFSGYYDYGCYWSGRYHRWVCPYS